MGGKWKTWERKGTKTQIDEQLRELEGLGNVIIATVRGNKIKRRFVRFI